MEQLSGQDATFLYLESARMPMHIGSVNIYDPQTAPGGAVRFKQILDLIDSRLHRARAFRQRLVEVPLALDYPYWIQDPDFDLEFHVRHIALPKPGDWRQLCIQVARLHSRQLDVSRPLWEFYVIEGLDNVAGLPQGSYALLAKIHHSAIDGATGAEITAALHDLGPAGTVTPPDRPWVAEQPPSPLELLVRTYGNNIRKPFQLMKVLSQAVPVFAETRRRLQRQELKSAGDVPKTIFNARVSAHRVFEGRDFDLADIKTIRKALPGATVNDAVLAICGGAIRRYLLAHDALPAESLVAMAPVNVRVENEKGTGGNQVSALAVAIRTDIPDAMERLAAVHAHTRDAKELSNAYGARLMTDINKHIPAATLALAGRLVTQMGIGNLISPLFNCVITNVPGPQVPLYMNGARLVTQYGLGPVGDSIGLFMPVLSYNSRLTISFTSCREIMPDPERFAACIEESFAETLSAARQVTAGDAVAPAFAESPASQ
ncbi:MAG: wax ester/triacylglycerol synthase family O-acyltransferase [Gammaproteobacteria bacterium]|nr:wax ester/triacylglycerol synthase family O-acyltransferase [Gammaproteobacteria bacterium]